MLSILMMSTVEPGREHLRYAADAEWAVHWVDTVLPDQLLSSQVARLDERLQSPSLGQANDSILLAHTVGFCLDFNDEVSQTPRVHRYND